MKPILLLSLVITWGSTVLAVDNFSHCYKILVDGKDRSLYQYVNSRFVTFMDPLWKQNPQIQKVRLIDASTGKPEQPPAIRPGNPNPLPWGGIAFAHLQPGKTLTLEAEGKTVSFQRTSGPGCPRMDLCLDGRWNGYEVLQYRPFEVSISLGVLASHVHRMEDQRVLVKIGLPIFLGVSAVLYRCNKRDQGTSYPIQRYSGNQMLILFPKLEKEILDQWGVSSSYLLFSPLQPGDELKIIGKLPTDREVFFFVRRISDGDRK